MSGVDVLEVMDSEYWMVYGQLHSLCHAANHDERHGQVSTKHVLACLDGTGAAIDAAVEARSAVAELFEAAEAAHHHLKELRRRVSATSHDDADYLTEVESDTSALHAALNRCLGGES